MNNPFSYIKLSICPARGDAFIGRQRELAQIMPMLTAPKPYHVSLSGLPHIGKTSFLIKLHGVLSEMEGYLPVRVPAFVEGDFCNNMVHIIDALAEEELALDSIADSISDDADSEELVGALRLALQTVTESGRRTILLLDEFERILGPTEDQLALNSTAQTGWAQEEYALFLDLLMDRDLNFVCVTASRPQMANILYRYRPAHDPFVPMLLCGFDDVEMKAYFDILKQGDIRLNGTPLGEEADEAQKQELLRLCGRSPYLLTVMGNELFENNKKTGAEAKKSIKGLFDRCRDIFQPYFNDIINFMVAEEQKKMRSFSHIVKCYFGQFEDYQDIKERCIALGYLDLAAKNSPYTYRGRMFEFEDRDDKFEILHQNGNVLTAEEKDRAGLVYITVSPLFTDYLFAVREPIGRKQIIPLDLVDDARDLLTGLIHTMRDITRKEMRTVCQKEQMGAGRWNELLAKRYRFERGGDRQLIYKDDQEPNRSKKYAHWKCSGGTISRVTPRMPSPNSNDYRNQQAYQAAWAEYNQKLQRVTNDWNQCWSETGINVSSTSLGFVAGALCGSNDVMPALDPINLMDQTEVFCHYWQYDNQPMFSNYFGILPDGQTQLRAMMEHLKEYRNKVSHFSRYGYGFNEIHYSKIYCRQLLKGIYYYLYSGEKCPAGDPSETPGI